VELINLFIGAADRAGFNIEGDAMYKNIFVPTDGSPLSRAAAEKAVKLAKILGAKITAFFAAPAPTPLIYKGMLPVGYMTTTEHAKLAEKVAAQHLDYIEKLASAAKVRVKSLHVTDDYPADAILAAVKKEKCDLIYMASHGHTGFKKSLLGSQTQKVLAQSAIPVLVHR
jgi:nucleotide-binding universal stress UspA family protein